VWDYEAGELSLNALLYNTAIVLILPEVEAR
jgi:hypothetical protein